MTIAARVWLDPEFRDVGTLPPYPSPPGSWDELFAAIEVEAAERALKAVRLELSRWRKPEFGRSDEARGAFDEVVGRIDSEIEAINAFAWGHGPRPKPIDDLYPEIRTLHDGEIVAKLPRGVCPGCGQMHLVTLHGPGTNEDADQTGKPPG
jgi:hypothetical protein